ncbi:MAG: magnesium transporter [Dehalococcoidia bacterium]|nr:MAG: magnesium transporter [Dehalococcoidia bacterium]
MGENRVVLLSSLVGRPVRGSGGDPIGKLHDVVVRLDEPAPPIVVGIVVCTVGRREVFIPIDEVATMDDRGVALRTSRIDVRPFVRRPGEILLNKDLLDTKVIDLTRNRVARANDLEIDRVRDGWQVTAVDVSGAALAARIGLTRWFRGSRRLVPWDQIDVFASQIPVGQPGVRHAKLAALHPGDLAQIMDEVAAPQAREIVAALDEARAADAVEDIDPKLAVSVVGGVNPEQAADILEEMGDDAAADVLGDLPPDEAEAILRRMDPEDAEAVRTLMSYPDNTAGGLMTTEVVTLPGPTTVDEAMAHLRNADWVPDPLPAIYLLDDESRLAGIVPLRELVLADPAATLQSIATKPAGVCRPDVSAIEAARLIARYNLVALPVEDESGVFLGVVTIDDALDFLINQRRRRSGLFA